MGEKLRLSIVVEWENVRLADSGRAREMLRRVGRQAAELPADLPSGPVELIVLHDDELDAVSVASFVEEALGPVHPHVELRVVPTPGGGYYALKNAGARLARGDIVVFLDSDVIPEDGWLKNLAPPFASREVEVVAGSTYTETTTMYAKAFALFWFFPLRPDDGPVVVDRIFFANNVAFRRETFARYSFPAVDGAARGACYALSQTLRKEGIVIYRNPRARVAHPPPHGLRGFLAKGIAEGRDDLVEACLAGNSRRTSVRASLRRFGKQQRNALRQIARHRRRVGLSPAGAAGAAGIATAFYSLVLFGELMTHAAPRAMRRRFQI